MSAMAINKRFSFSISCHLFDARLYARTVLIFLASLLASGISQRESSALGLTPPVSFQSGRGFCVIINNSADTLRNVEVTFVESGVIWDTKKTHALGDIAPKQSITLNQLDEWHTNKCDKARVECSGYVLPAEFVLRSDEGFSGRLENEAYINWLTGIKIVIVPGTFFDDYWMIQKGEVSNFAFIGLSKNPADDVYTAQLSFTAQAGGKAIQVKGNMRYREVPGTTKIQFVDFTPLQVTKSW